MGYTRVPTIYSLTFEDFPGLEVRMKSVRIGKLRRVLEAMESEDDEDLDGQLDEMINLVASNLVSWNLEDEEIDPETDEVKTIPVPASKAGVEDLDFDMLMAILNGWTTILTGPEKELGKGSSSGPSSGGPKPELPAMIDM